MLEKYPESKDWHHVRFSDEVYFGRGPADKVWILRKPGERHCYDCIREENTQSKETKRYHAWVAIGFDFKPPLHFYNIDLNKNGKMTAAYYTSAILPIVADWQQQGHNFVLEEDRDSSQLLNPLSAPAQFKRKHSLTTYFNAPSSPDLSPIENALSCTEAGDTYGTS